MSATESLPSVRFVTVEEGGAPMKAWTFKIAKTGLLAVTVLAVLAIGFAPAFGLIANTSARVSSRFNLPTASRNQCTSESAASINGFRFAANIAAIRSSSLFTVAPALQAFQFRPPGSLGRNISPSFNGTSEVLDARFA